MISIGIDTFGLSEEFNLSQADIDGLMEFSVKEITAAFAREWERTANRTLRQTKRQYVNSILVGEEGRYTGYAMLSPRSFIANAVEMGADPFDMKVGFENSSKRKSTKKGGWYLTIPYRIATPGAIAESEVFSDIMPPEIYKAVRETESNTPPGVRSSLKKTDIPDKYAIPSTRKTVIGKSRTFESYTRKNSIYEGLGRKSEGTGYGTFRRVSNNSDNNSWIHPGIEARNLADITLNEFKDRIPHEVDIAIDKYLANLLNI